MFCAAICSLYLYYWRFSLPIFSSIFFRLSIWSLASIKALFRSRIDLDSVSLRTKTSCSCEPSKLVSFLRPYTSAIIRSPKRSRSSSMASFLTAVLLLRWVSITLFTFLLRAAISVSRSVFSDWSLLTKASYCVESWTSLCFSDTVLWRWFLS